jgi:two-component system response regulator AtoC
LLQVLQDHEFHRLGGKETIAVDVRVIAATHRDLEKAVADGTFREDLYYRLNVIDVRVPALRERKEDIPGLAAFLARKHSEPGSPPPEIPAALLETFLSYDWPGNIRELENAVRRFLILRDARPIIHGLRRKLAGKPAGCPVSVENVVEMPKPPALASAANGAALGIPTNGAALAVAVNGTAGHHPNGTENGTPLLIQVANAKREAERSVILAALKSTKWNRRQASVLLQVEYKVLLYKMKVLSIKKEKAAEAR